jgi:hypothetical protein
MIAMPNRIARLLAFLVTRTIGTAHADTLSYNAIFGQSNAVNFGSFSSSPDVEGRTVAGSELTGGATFAINPAGAVVSSFSAFRLKK